MEPTHAREPELRPRARGDHGGGERRSLALVALTSDESLLEALESVLANDRRLHVVDRETDLAVALMDPRIGVALLDADKLKSPLDELTQRLHNQFPDLILVVAGGTHQQAKIADQVASGTIYRFLHKPVSEQRVKLFVEAAMRRHEATPTRAVASLEAVSIGYRRPAMPRAFVIAGTALLVTATLAIWQLSTTPGESRVRARGGVPPAALAVTTDPRLADARDALARGELVTPVGRSAADFYRAVLSDDPNDPEAREGLGRVIGELCSLAEREVSAGRLDEASRYLESARRLDPRHVRISFIATEIDNERARATLAARQAAARARAAAALTAGEMNTSEFTAPAVRPSAPAPAVATSAPAAVRAPVSSVNGGAVPAASSTQIAVSAPAAPPVPPAPAVSAAPAASAPTPAASPLPSPSPTAATSPAVASSQVRSVVSASTLQRTKYREPRYPDAARAKDVGGWVDLEFTVRSDGSVAAAQAIRAEPEGVFEQAAIDAVSGWHYLPVLRDGAPVSQRASVRIRFTVEH